MTKKAEKEAARQEAIAFLKKHIKPGDRVYTSLRHVSRSGMMRHISVLIASETDGKPDIFNITGWVGTALDYKRADDGGLKVGGCGMDMGFSVVYSLSRVLFRDDFRCIGKGCPANDHRNSWNESDKKWRDESKTVGQIHSDAGYALTQAWI